MQAHDRIAHSHRIGARVNALLRRRMQTAAGRFAERTRKALEEAMRRNASGLPALDRVSEPWRYAVDVAQRSIIFWDTLRRRGNDYVERSHRGAEPALKYRYEPVMDGRALARPVNYALVSIVPPAGAEVDPRKRPYVIIDPRAGHGPGIGGFKEESEVGVALAAGHPVYFVVFSQQPEPGQTLLDVCEAEREFVRAVRARHPRSAKPVVLGNCQGGWAAMMLAAADPDDMGPVILVGSPMSYWSGAWDPDQAPNPMRYAGGLLGGTWGASLAADLGNGLFDGAHLVQNFESLNPAANYWDKYTHLFANADTEPARFLEFERWWSTYYLMNRGEIEWITRNLFVGNKLWSGEVRQASGKAFDLREVKSPIVLFASLGDNITPPQQAFNWVADVFGSTEEIKAGGHVIVGLVHEDVGHLGIFVSGKVARKETREIVGVIEAIELLHPGLYGMEIVESGEDGQVRYDVRFREYRLEDVVARLNPRGRDDERPFEAVETVSQLNQRAYEVLVRPFVTAAVTEAAAAMLRESHPLRMRNWAVSDAFNPWLAWLGPAAEAVKASRIQAPSDGSLRGLESLGAEMASAAIDLQRDLRDAFAEAAFFTLYGNAHAALAADGPPRAQGSESAGTRNAPVVQQALARMEQGGYDEAFARVGSLLALHDEPVPRSLLDTAQRLMKDYARYLPSLPPAEARRVRGEQEIIVRHDRERALQTLPRLLDGAARRRLRTLLDRLMHDERVAAVRPTAGQRATVERIRGLLAEPRRSRRPRRSAS